MTKTEEFTIEKLHEAAIDLMETFGWTTENVIDEIKKLAPITESDS